MRRGSAADPRAHSVRNCLFGNVYAQSRVVALCNVMLVQMRFPIVVTLAEARHVCFSQCNAGADVVQAQIKFVVTLGKL